MPARTLAGFAAAVGAIVLAVAVYFVVIADRDAKAARVTERSETVLALQGLENVLSRAESAQRSYLLTREERFLESYRRAAAEIPVALDAVASRHPRSEALVALVDAKVAELRRGVDVREADGFAKALREIRTGDGPWLTEAIQAVNTEMEAVERAALGEQRRAWFGSIALADTVFLGANVILLALVVAAGFGVRAEMRRREERERERARILELQERILGIVSHDLRNPLSAIRSGAGLLSGAGLGPQHAKVAAIVLSSARRMEGIIRDLLDYTRLRAGSGIPLSLRPADVGEVCSRVVEEAALAAGDDAVELSLEGGLSGEWDPDRLQQAVGNLVANGLRYAPPGAPVRVRAIGEPDAVRVEVENDGPPIPPEETRSLFAPFHAGAHGDKLHGLGLGLFIVRSIVEAHGGGVDVHSGPSGPVTFTMRVPRSRSGLRRARTSVWRPTRDAASAGAAAER